MVAAVVLAVVAAVGGVVLGPDDPAPLDIGRGPDRYRITYRVETNGAPDTTEVVLVERPFSSRLEAATSTQVSTFRRLSFRSGGADPIVVAQPPTVAASDLRLDVVLGDALGTGRLERRGQRKVAGRRCQVYRSGPPLSSGSLGPASRDERTDNCVDGNGLLLSEEYVDGGKLSFRRTAERVDEDPAIDPSAFAVGEPTVPVDKGGGSVLEVEPTSRREGPFWEIDGPPPDGFRLRGRYAVVPPQSDAFADPTRANALVASAADVFVRGGDLIVIDQGATLGGVPAFPATPGARTVDVGALGAAEVLLLPKGPELRVLFDGGRFVRLYGTVPVDELAALARRLRQVQGAGLVYREGGG